MGRLPPHYDILAQEGGIKKLLPEILAMIYEHIDDLVSIREAFVGTDRWSIDRVVRKRMRNMTYPGNIHVLYFLKRSGRG